MADKEFTFAAGMGPVLHVAGETGLYAHIRGAILTLSPTAPI